MMTQDDFRQLRAAMATAPTSPSTYAPLGSLAEAALHAATGSLDGARLVHHMLLSRHHPVNLRESADRAMAGIVAPDLITICATVTGSPPVSALWLEAIIDTRIDHGEPDA